MCNTQAFAEAARTIDRFFGARASSPAWQGTPREQIRGVDWSGGPELNRWNGSLTDSASDLVRRGAKRLEQSKEMVIQLRAIEKNLNVNAESRI